MTHQGQPNWIARHEALTVVLLLVAIGIIGSFIVAGTSINSFTNNTTSSTSDETEQEEVNENEPDIPAEYESALSQADSYANNLHMSKQGVYDQLVSEYGGQFKVAAAKYAIENVVADWKENALVKARDYQDTQHLSPAAIHDQLTSEYGENFTQAEADYAIRHLNN